MNEKISRVLEGGNMNSPILRGKFIYKSVTTATATIHELLKHVISKGIEWVPESFGVDTEGKHVLSYIEGDVPHDTPEWIWEERILLDIASRLRLWHDATHDFYYKNAQWLLENDEGHEVICHNDFAPYNCVFRNKQFTGLIDFDTCSPGSRLWDIAYTAYRFVPIRPTDDGQLYIELSPFSQQAMIDRLRRFLKAYSFNKKDFLYTEIQVLDKVVKRLKALSYWSACYGEQTRNREIIEHSKMYLLHADWVQNQL